MSGSAGRQHDMRLMQAGHDAHAVGEPTCPAIGRGDGLLVLSGSGETPVTVHYARLAREHGAEVLAITTRTDGAPSALAHQRIVLPVGRSRQFDGTLLEQSSLLTLDAVILRLTEKNPDADEAMQLRHADLQ